MIRNRKHLGCFVNFNNMKFDKISPMDFDAFMEFSNKLFIFIETKYLDTKMPFGQQLALERLCDACQDADKVSVVFITSHKDKTGDDNIDLGNSTVTKYRWEKKWHVPNLQITLHDAVLKLKEKYV